MVRVSGASWGVRKCGGVRGGVYKGGEGIEGGMVMGDY